MRSARIDCGALVRNIAVLQRSLGIDDEFVADVSGDGFGHGAVPVARAMIGAGAGVSVATAAEARLLLHAGITAMVGGIGSANARGRASGIDGGIGADDRSAAVYGAGPLAIDLGLEPVMRVSARVMSTSTIAAGDGVSYGYSWRAPKNTRLALVPLGYADGVSRSASNRAVVWLGGAERPIVGRVAMDVFVLDIENDDIAPGEEAVIFGGSRATVNDWSAVLGLDPLEVTSGIGPRVPREYS